MAVCTCPNAAIQASPVYPAVIFTAMALITKGKVNAAWPGVKEVRQSLSRYDTPAP